MLKKYLKEQYWFWRIITPILSILPINLFNSFPREIIVELTNACNLRCPACPTHCYMKRSRGFMDFDLYKSRIIDDLLKHNRKPTIFFDFAGEPTLHPRLPEFLDYASKNGFKTFVSTNASLLTPEMSKALIESGLSSIHLCLDGFTKEAQEVYRVNSSFDVVKKNIEEFLSIRSELQRNGLVVTIQTLITSLSENDLDKIADWARGIGADAINFKGFSLGAFVDPEIKSRNSFLLPQQEKYLRTTSKIVRPICLVPWRQAVVLWSGDLGLCCMDFDGEAKSINIGQLGLFQALNSKKSLAMRKGGFLRNYPVCHKCDLVDAQYMGYNIRLK